MKYTRVQYNSREEALAAWRANWQRKQDWIEATQEEWRELRKNAALQQQ